MARELQRDLIKKARRGILDGENSVKDLWKRQIEPLTKGDPDCHGLDYSDIEPYCRTALYEAVVSSTRPRNGPQEANCMPGVDMQQKVVEYLIAQGADPDKPDKLGRTALMEAAFLGRMSLVQILVDAKAKINRKDNEGETPLFSAVRGSEIREENVEVVKWLIMNQADTNVVDFEGCTAQHIACFSGDTEMSWWLFNRGSYKNRFSVEDAKPRKQASSPKKEEQDREFMNFLEAHAANKPGTFSFSNGQRYLTGYSYGNFLNINEKEERDKLVEYIEKYYRIGFPLWLCELLPEGAKMRLYFDFEALCAPGSEDKAYELMTGDMLTWTVRKLLKVFAPAVLAKGAEGVIEFLIFRMSGTDPDGLTKSCCRIVSFPAQWRDRETGNENFSRLVVDKETLKIIMGALAGELDKLADEGNEGITRAKNELLALSDKNTFKSVVSQNSITAKYGLQVPFCDELTEKSLMPAGRAITGTSKVRLHVGAGWEEDYDAAREQKGNITVEENLTYPSIEHIQNGDLVNAGIVTWTDATAVTSFNTGALRY
jgi:hypothetical protein